MRMQTAWQCHPRHSSPDICATPVGSPLESFNEPGTVGLQSILRDPGTLRNGGYLGSDRMVLSFSDIIK